MAFRPLVLPEIVERVVELTSTLDRLALRKTSSGLRQATPLGLGVVLLWRSFDLQGRDRVRSQTTNEAIRAVAVSSLLVALARRASGVVTVSDAPTGRRLHKLQHQGVSSCVFSDDGTQLATTGVSLEVLGPR